MNERIEMGIFRSLNVFLEYIRTERGIKLKGWEKGQTLGLL